jgi:hypothetical protein
MREILANKIKVGKKPGKFEKKPMRMGKTGFYREKFPFFQNTCLKSMLNHLQINDGMF